MKLLNFGKREDYGTEYYVSLLTIKGYSLLQMSFDVSAYDGWFEWPYLHVQIGYNRLFSVLFSIGKLGFSFDICSRNWYNVSSSDMG